MKVKVKVNENSETFNKNGFYCPLPVTAQEETEVFARKRLRQSKEFITFRERKFSCSKFLRKLLQRLSSPDYIHLSLAV